MNVTLPIALARPQLIDPFGRAVTYMRVSVTDRCDLRCVYCMAEDMSFLPKPEILSLEEIERLCGAFIDLGVTRLRITGGEPLVRRDVMTLISRLGARIGDGLEELTLTTNGTQLARFADQLARAGIKRINVSLDSLQAERFARITRWGKLEKVLEGIAAAKDAGLAIKINMVALHGENEDEFLPMVEYCAAHGFDLSFIETMPMGEISGDRAGQYVSLADVRDRISDIYTLQTSDYVTGGPARYVRVQETGQRIGFITPLSHNFCENCNRVRLSVTGMLYMCLGQEDCADLRKPLREGGDLEAAIREAIERKPKGHDFKVAQVRPAVARFMSMTGG